MNQFKCPFKYMWCHEEHCKLHHLNFTIGWGRFTRFTRLYPYNIKLLSFPPEMFCRAWIGCMPWPDFSSEGGEAYVNIKYLELSGERGEKWLCFDHTSHTTKWYHFLGICGGIAHMSILSLKIATTQSSHPLETQPVPAPPYIWLLPFGACFIFSSPPPCLDPITFRFLVSFH